MAHTDEEAQVLTMPSPEADASPATTTPGRQQRVVAARLVAAVAFAACVATCAAAVVALRPAAEPAMATARQLLESDELGDIMTDNVVSLSRKHNRHDVKRAFADYLKHLPADAGLESVQLSPTERSAMLHSMKRLGGSDAHRLAKDLVEITRSTLASKGDREDLKQRLVSHLEPRLPELRKLYGQLFPRELRQPGRAHDDDRIPSGEAGSTRVNAERLRLVRNFDSWKASAAMAAAPAQARQLGDRKGKVDGAIAAQVDSVLVLLHSRFGGVISAPRRLEEQYAFKDDDGNNPRVYESAMECIMGEMTEAPTNVFECISTMIANSMDSVTSIFDGDEDEAAP